MSDVVVVFQPEGKRTKMSPGSTIFEAANEAGVGVRSECGGNGRCGKCKVIIKNSDAVSEVTDAERRHLTQSEIDSGYRLACQTRIHKNITVAIPPESRLKTSKIQVLGIEREVELNPYVKKFHLALPKPTLSDVRPDVKRLLDALLQQNKNVGLEIDYDVLKELPNILRNANWDVTVTIWDDQRIVAVEPGDTSTEFYGFAIDIGTSKVVGHLVDLKSGETVAVRSIENPQTVHGADFMTRITFATANKANLDSLQKLVIDGVNRVLQEACTQSMVDLERVYHVMAVGNTAMHHIFFGIQPKYIAMSPFTPAVNRQINVTAKQLNIETSPKGLITFLPIIAGFVGADAVADLLATGICGSDELSLLIDLGTNTEIFVGNKNDVLCCSCASGPAFEGAHIEHGMKAFSGAIERVRIGSDFKVQYETIDGVKPKGLCGSAMIDIVAEMLKNGIIDSQGRFNSQMDTRRLSKKGFVVAWEDETATGHRITVTQKDIREIQLAKAAIFTGCSILMKRKKLRQEDLDRLLIAGAFGNYINPEKAKFIGLVPDIPASKVTFVGNTAISGAKMALKSKDMMEEMELILKKVRYLELGADPDFNQKFMKALYFVSQRFN